MSAPPPRSPSASLRELRERVRAPGAGQKEIDALVVALFQPLWLGEDVPQRAEELLLVIEDLGLVGLQDSDGRQVDAVAARALLALGEPYASRLPERGRKALQESPALPPQDEPKAKEDGEAPPAGGCLWRLVVVPLLLVAAWFEMDALAGLSLGENTVLLFTGLTIIGPACLLLFRFREKTELLYKLSLVFALLSLPVVGLIGLGSLFLGGSNAANRQLHEVIEGALHMMALRVVLAICLVAAMSAGRKKA